MVHSQKHSIFQYIFFLSIKLNEPKKARGLSRVTSVHAVTDLSISASIETNNA